MAVKDDVRETRRALVDQLRRGRGQLGLTQQDLADVLDVARGTVNKIESGGPSPALDNLIRALHLVGYELLAVPGSDPLALRVKHGPAARVPQRVDRLT